MTAKRGDAPFDLDAARAARREAAGKGFAFTWQGGEYVCLSAKEWPVTVLSKLAEGKVVEALQQILGDEQSEKFMAGEPTSGDVEDLITALSQYSGIGDSGNS